MSVAYLYNSSKSTSEVKYFYLKKTEVKGKKPG